MKLKHKLTPRQLTTGALTKEELVSLHDILLNYNENVSTSHEDGIIYFHYNENNIRYILSRTSSLISGAFNLIDRQEEAIKRYEALLNDPLYKAVKENNDKIVALEEKIEQLEGENAELIEDKDSAQKEINRIEHTLRLYGDDSKLYD